MSSENIIRSQPWFKQMEQQRAHVLLHRTDCQRAFSILNARRIHGCAWSSPDATEAYPHFVNEDWPPIYNRLDVRWEITLRFLCSLPARYRGEGPLVPEEGWLEVYARGVDPWQCCLHPDSPPLLFLGVTDWTPKLAWHDFCPIGRTEDSTLHREVERACNVRREIFAAFE